jgi:hypothetical protein
MADRRIFDPPAGLDRSHDDFTGVDADARLRGGLSLRRESLRMLSQCLLHAQRRIECALRMVLVSHRRAEQREDPVGLGIRT